MTAVAVALVVIAAVLHACWNLLMKQSTDKLAFIWWAGVAGTVLLFPVAAWLSPWPQWPPHLWPRILLAALLRALYFLMLTAAYARGDLSLVYPVARGVGPIIVALAAVLLLDERVTYQAMGGIAAVAAGAYVMHLPRASVRAVVAPLSALASPAIGYAVMTGLLTAAYSLTDKWNISTGISPAWYAYLTIPVAALLLTPAVVTRAGWRAEWRRGSRRVVAVAVCMSAAYLLVLYALRIAPVSYVAPTRELAIVFGTALGIVVLGERHGAQRFAGALMIVAGVVLVVSSSSGSP